MTPEFHLITGSPFSTIHNRRGWGDPLLFIGTWGTCPPSLAALPHGRLHPVTHSHHSQPRRSLDTFSDEPSLSVTRERGPSAGTVRPLSINLFQHQATYPAYAGLFVPFQNKVLPTVFHLTLSTYSQVLASDPKVVCHIPGPHEVSPPLLFVSLEISICSALVESTADGCDAMRHGGASQFFPITRPSYY